MIWRRNSQPSYERMCSFQSMIGVAARGESVNFNSLSKLRAYYLQPSKHNITLFPWVMLESLKFEFRIKPNLRAPRLESSPQALT